MNRMSNENIGLEGDSADPIHQQARASADPCVIVIFGASGDLMKRKLMPALYNLAAAHLLPKQFAVVGYAFTEHTDESFRDQLTSDINEFATDAIDPRIWEWFLERIYYVQGEFADPAGFARLSAKLADIEPHHGTEGNRFFYLAVAPQFFCEVVKQLGNTGLVNEGDHNYARVVIEKPFGRDLESARKLNQRIKAVLHERQIYRIDHYLGKETVQNLLVFRFQQ